MAKIIVGQINIEPLLKATAFLDKALKVARSDLEKAGAIQAFEFCYELAWKYIKKVLAYRGINVASPRQAFRAAAEGDLIADPEVWFGFIAKRNQTTHVYNEMIAEDIYQMLPGFLLELKKLVNTLIELKEDA